MKQYFTGFFTGACLVASAVMFMGASNKNFGDIVVDSITVRNSDGKDIIKISESTTTGRGGVIQTNYANGEISSLLTTNTKSSLFLLYNSDGETNTLMGEGSVGFYNPKGQMVASIGVDSNGLDGIAHLLDRYGDTGWYKTGKQ